jgi:hypothetical protein
VWYSTEAFEVRGAPAAPSQPVPSVWLFLRPRGSGSLLSGIRPSGVGLGVPVAMGRQSVNAPRAPPACGLRNEAGPDVAPAQRSRTKASPQRS